MGFLDRAKKALSNSINANHSVQRSVKLVCDAENRPAVSLEKIKTNGGISLTKSAEVAQSSLVKNGLMGIRGRGIVVLDHSGSMNADYKNGGVQELTDKALAYILQFDASESVDVIKFDSNVSPPVKVTLANYKGVVDRELYQPHSMGSTNLTAALEKVLVEAKTTDQLIYVAIITDGNPNDKTSATRLICELAGYPVFVKFMAFGNVPYLDELDNLGNDRRLLDNVNAQSFSSIASMTDEVFSNAMSEEFNDWITLAKTAGVLTD